MRTSRGWCALWAVQRRAAWTAALRAFPDARFLSRVEVGAERYADVIPGRLYPLGTLHTATPGEHHG